MPRRRTNNGRFMVARAQSEIRSLSIAHLGLVLWSHRYYCRMYILWKFDIPFSWYEEDNHGPCVQWNLCSCEERASLGSRGYILRFVSRCRCLFFVQAGDGVYAIQDGQFIQLVDLKGNSTRILVAISDVKDVRTSCPSFSMKLEYSLGTWAASDVVSMATFA